MVTKLNGNSNGGGKIGKVTLKDPKLSVVTHKYTEVLQEFKQVYNDVVSNDKISGFAVVAWDPDNIYTQYSTTDLDPTFLPSFVQECVRRKWLEASGLGG